MSAIRIFAVLYFASFITLKFVDGGNCVQPSIHLDGRTKDASSHAYKANTALAFFDTTSPFSFIDDGMKYANGVITVPYTGKYFVYCQLFYRKPHAIHSRHELWLNGVAFAETGRQLLTAKDEYEGSYYTGMVIKLKTGDKLSCRLRWDSNLWDGTRHSYFGAYML